LMTAFLFIGAPSVAIFSPSPIWWSN